MVSHRLTAMLFIFTDKKLKLGEVKWLFQVHTAIQCSKHSEFWLLSNTFPSTSTLCSFPKLEKGPCVFPTCHLLCGLSEREGIRWTLSTEHLLISIERLISSCCFVKSSNKKRNPFLFIVSWETLSPFLLFNETCFLMRNLICTLLKGKFSPCWKVMDQQPPVRGALYFSALCTHCLPWKGGWDS